MISIVIPYYKSAFFETTLQSLAAQTCRDFKVYIGDDASPEDPTILLELFQGRFDFIYHRFENNLGSYSLVKQWERCISLVNEEEWVMILGDDDVLSKNAVEAFYSNLEEARSFDVIRFANCIIDEAGEVKSNVYYRPQKESSVDFLFKKSRTSLSEYVFKKKQIIEIGFKDFPLAWCSDILAVLEFSNFNTVYSINEALVYIRVSELSISGSNDNIKLKHLASEKFSSYVIFKKFEFFNKEQQLSILYGYEVAIKRNRKLEIKDWLILLKFYVKNFDIMHMSRFVRRFILYVFNF